MIKDPLNSIDKLLRDKFGKLAPSPSSLSVNGVKRAIAQTIEKGIDELLPITANEIGISNTELRNRLRAHRFIFNADLVGSTSSSDRWATFDVQINLGLTQFYFHMVKIFAARIGVMGTTANVAEGSRVPFDQSVRDINDLMRAFFDGNLLSHKGMPIVDLSQNQLIIADKILHEIKTFFLAHEFGHIVTHIKKGGIYELEAATYYTDHLTKDSEISQFKDRWSEEIAADIIGQKLLLARHNNVLDRILAFSSSELFFIVLNMLETFYARAYGQHPPIGTHPPSKIRLELLRFGLRDNEHAALQMGQAFEQIADQILECVHDELGESLGRNAHMEPTIETATEMSHGLSGSSLSGQACSQIRKCYELFMTLLLEVDSSLYARISSLKWKCILTTRRNYLRGGKDNNEIAVASCNLYRRIVEEDPENTVYLHPYFLKLPEVERLKILHFFLVSKFTNRIDNTVDAMQGADAFIDCCRRMKLLKDD